MLLLMLRPLLSSLLPLTLLLATACADNCIVHLSNATLDNTWQSSALDNAGCMATRTAEQEAQIKKDTVETLPMEKFFHSGGSKTMVKGFHWFVMALKRRTAVSHFSIRTSILPFRTKLLLGFELWTSEHSIDFGAERCNSTDIPEKFASTLDRWKQCGITSTSNLTSGLPIVLPCVAMVQTILLRRPLRTESKVDRYANFAALPAPSLTVPAVRARVSPSEVVSVGDNLTIDCSLPCSKNGGREFNLSLTSEKDGDLNSRQLSLRRAEISNAGVYWCKLADWRIPLQSNNVSVHVFRHPENLQAVVLPSLSRCLSRAVSRTHVFQFVMSAGSPSPAHSCSLTVVTATDGVEQTTRLNLTKVARFSSASAGVDASTWTVEQAVPNLGQFLFACDAVQRQRGADNSVATATRSAHSQWRCNASDFSPSGPELGESGFSKWLPLLLLVLILLVAAVCGCVYLVLFSSKCRARQSPAKTADSRPVSDEQEPERAELVEFDVHLDASVSPRHSEEL